MLLVVAGMDANRWERFVEKLGRHNGHPKANAQVAIDRSWAYLKGVKENFGNAVIGYDKFHGVSQGARRWKPCTAEKRGRMRWRGSGWKRHAACGARIPRAG